MERPVYIRVIIIPTIDPDYFLTFGDACHKNVFGIPENKIINIGWAFKSYLKQQHLNTEFFPDTFFGYIRTGNISESNRYCYLFCKSFSGIQVSHQTTSSGEIYR